MLWRSFLLRVLVVLLLLCSPAVFAKKKPPEKPININTATSAQLQLVPGIGPATADKILQMRKSYGAFKSVDDLLAIRGIGPKRLEKIRKYLVAGKSASSAKITQVPACAGCEKTKAPLGKNTSQKKPDVPATDAPATPEQGEPNRWPYRR